MAGPAREGRIRARSKAARGRRTLVRRTVRFSAEPAVAVQLARPSSLNREGPARMRTASASDPFSSFSARLQSRPFGNRGEARAAEEYSVAADLRRHAEVQAPIHVVQLPAEACSFHFRPLRRGRLPRIARTARASVLQPRCRRGSFDWFIRLVIQMRIGRRHEPNLFRTPSQRAQDLQSSGEILLSTDGVTFIAKPQTDVASESSRRHLREELGWSVDIAPLSVDGSSVISRYTCHSVRL